MKQNKRFALLVVMVLLANCLFAGLASAATYVPTVVGYNLPSTATFTYNRAEMNPYGELYKTKDIVFQLKPDATAGFNTSLIRGGWVSSGLGGTKWIKDESDNDVFVGYADDFKFAVTSDNASVVEVIGGKDMTATRDPHYEYVDPDGDDLFEEVWVVEKVPYAAKTLRIKKAGTANITVQAYTADDLYIGRSYPTGYSATFTVNVKQNVAGNVVLTKKPTAKNYAVGDSITAALASSSMSTTFYTTNDVLYLNLDNFYGTNDILAWVYGQGLDYIPSYSTEYVSVPTEWKVSETQARTGVYDFYDSKTRTWYTPSKYKQVSVAEYQWSGMVTYYFNDVEWSVSPADAAEVTVSGNKATFTFKKDGKVTITCSMKGDPTIKGSVEYTIDKANTTTPVADKDALDIFAADGDDSGTIRLIKGETKTLQLKAAGLTDLSELTFKSSDTKIAKVSKTGLITGVSKGTATITATNKAGKSDTFTIKVSKVPVQQLKAAKTITVKVGETAKLSVKVKPAYAYDTRLKYTSSDKKVAKVDSTGTVTGVKAGKASVTVTAKDGSKTSFKIDVKVK